MMKTVKIKELTKNLATGFSEHASLNPYLVNQALTSGQTYTISHTGVGENVIIFYTGSISITNVTIDGNTILNASISVNTNPLVLPFEWAESISITIQASANSQVNGWYLGT